MITGVQDIYYIVSDMKKAIIFYTEALQMKLKSEDEGWTALECGDVQVGLHPTEKDEKIFRVPRDSHGVHGQADQPWGHMLVFEDIDRSKIFTGQYYMYIFCESVIYHYRHYGNKYSICFNK